MSGRSPNLLVIITDQQRAHTVLPDGECLTPNLQELGAQGVRFERAYATNPICSPSRASFFTGHLPHSHGVTDVTHAVEAPRAQLKGDLPLWTQVLAARGYRGAYFGKWHVERSEQLQRFGFEEFELDMRLVGVQEYDRPVTEAVTVSGSGYRDFLLAGVSDEPEDAWPDVRLFDRGCEFIRAAAGARAPWMLVIGTEAPHDPYIAPRRLYERYDPQALSPPASRSDPMLDKPAVYRRMREVWSDLRPQEHGRAMACYYALCSLLDEQVGRILEVLRETGQEEDTLVLFTSDHGDYLGAHGLYLKGAPAFEEAYRVPLLFRGPGVVPGSVVARPVSLLDVPRTLVRLLLGEDFPCQGGELTPLLRGEETPGSGEAFAEFHGQRLAYTQRIVWRDRYKYVFNGFDYDELYDLEEDPFELVNLAGDPGYREVLEAMAALMWERVIATGDRTLGEAQYGTLRFAPVGPEGRAGPVG